MLDKLKALDTQLFLFLNGHHNAFFDPVMYWVSNKWFWIPLYLLIIILIIRTYQKRSVFILVCVGILVAVSDQISSHLIKPWVGRLRPSHNPAIEKLVHLSPAGAGGLHGFVSGHATNSFALLVFLSIVLSQKFNWLKWVLLIWALIICYSRIYVGVHYPGDVICGAILGSLIGYGIGTFHQWAKQYDPLRR